MLIILNKLIYSVIPSGSGNKYSIPLMLSLQGLTENKEKVEQILEENGIRMIPTPTCTPVRYVKIKSLLWKAIV